MPRGGHREGAGRPPGRRNERSAEIEAWSRTALQTQRVRNRTLQQLEDGTLPPQIEALLYHYAYGKPKEQLEHSSDPDFPLEIILRRNNHNGTEQESTE